MEWYIGTEWRLERKGLHKKVVDLKFEQLVKPHLVSKVNITVERVEGLGGRASKFLAPEQLGQEQTLEMGTALTPVDYYVELLLQQMLVGEKALCSICTADGEAGVIRFVVTMQLIQIAKEVYKLNVSEMYSLALRYKENGVAMFKQYPQFSHDYFTRAAKCLISFMPFDNLTAKTDGMDGSDLNALFIQIQTNLAACLLIQKRYEDVLYHTKFVETIAEPTEKSIYRRAMAFFKTKEYEIAQKLVESVHNYREKKEFIKLYNNITESRKSSDDHYKHFVQRMFS